MWPFLTAARRAGFFAKYHPVWAGSRRSTWTALWTGANGTARDVGLSAGGPDRAALPAGLRRDDRRDTLHVGVTYRTAAFSRVTVDGVMTAFLHRVDSLSEAACQPA